MNKKIIAKILDVTLKSVYNWEKEGRPIIRLIERYFEEKDLEEFLTTGRISRLENQTMYDEKMKEFILNTAINHIDSKYKDAALEDYAGYPILYFDPQDDGTKKTYIIEIFKEAFAKSTTKEELINLLRRYTEKHISMEPNIQKEENYSVIDSLDFLSDIEIQTLFENKSLVIAKLDNILNEYRKKESSFYMEDMEIEDIGRVKVDDIDI
jgi:hypothetical protein